MYYRTEQNNDQYIPAPDTYRLCSTLTYDVWMSQQVALHLECTDLVATTFDDVNAAAAPDPIHTIFKDRGVSWNTSSYKE